MKRYLLIPVFLFLVTCLHGSSTDELKAFPPAEEGMQRHILHLEKNDNEEALKVEIIVGKTLNLDAHNHYFLGGKIEAKTIQGWGYTRYIVKQMGQLAGTLMAINPDEPKVDRFIRLSGEPYLIRYNSRLPVVVYTPKDAEVRYRIWSAGEERKMQVE